jgi:hypothetical protein
MADQKELDNDSADNPASLTCQIVNRDLEDRWRHDYVRHKSFSFDFTHRPGTGTTVAS